MKNYKKKLEMLQSEEERYIQEKALEYQRKYNIDMSGDAWNDSTDAFRHIWGSAYLALKYNNAVSYAGTKAHEYLEFHQPESERKMDEWNNAIGREVANSINNEFKNPEKSFRWSHIEDMIADRAFKKIKENKVITSPTDNKLNNKYKGATGFAASINEGKPKASKHVTLEELKAPQEARKQKVHDMIQNAHKRKDTDKNKTKSSGSGQVYVREYTRSDGTKVRSYYRRR